VAAVDAATPPSHTSVSHAEHPLDTVTVRAHVHVEFRTPLRTHVLTNGCGAVDTSSTPLNTPPAAYRSSGKDPTHAVSDTGSTHGTNPMLENTPRRDAVTDRLSNADDWRIVGALRPHSAALVAGAASSATENDVSWVSLSRLEHVVTAHWTVMNDNDWGTIGFQLPNRLDAITPLHSGSSMQDSNAFRVASVVTASSRPSGSICCPIDGRKYCVTYAVDDVPPGGQEADRPRHVRVATNCRRGLVGMGVPESGGWPCPVPGRVTAPFGHAVNPRPGDTRVILPV